MNINNSRIFHWNILRLNIFHTRHLNIAPILRNKNIKSQAKIFQKLLGERTTGSKKWYPSSKEAFSAIQFNSSRDVRKQNNTKQNLRRINVLNKLFMSYITDLMATGSISDHIYGRGIQVTYVKIMPDFTHLHVLWTSKDTNSDIDAILDSYSGILRHELSKLRVMGQVPIIKFIRDKTNDNLTKISELLINIDLDNETCIDDKIIEKVENLQDLSMSYDVFGLNRQEIINKIGGKLKKSTDAWEAHKTKINSNK